MSDEQLPGVNEYRRLGPRDLLRQWLPPAVAGVALAGLGLGFSNRPGRHRPPSVEELPTPRDWRVDAQAAGRIATVTSLGQCQSLRITIDGDDIELSAYSHHQLKRIR